MILLETKYLPQIATTTPDISTLDGLCIFITEPNYHIEFQMNSSNWVLVTFRAHAEYVVYFCLGAIYFVYIFMISIMHLENA